MNEEESTHWVPGLMVKWNIANEEEGGSLCSNGPAFRLTDSLGV